MKVREDWQNLVSATHNGSMVNWCFLMGRSVLMECRSLD